MTDEAKRRIAIGALHDPHDARERMDPDFVLLTHCERCNKYDQVPRRVVHEAIRAHVEEECPGRLDSTEAIVVRVFYPKQ